MLPSMTIILVKVLLFPCVFSYFFAISLLSLLLSFYLIFINLLFWGLFLFLGSLQKIKEKGELTAMEIVMQEWRDEIKAKEEEEAKKNAEKK